MSTDIHDYIRTIAVLEWKPLSESGVETKGIDVKVLRYDETTGRAPTILLRFAAGATYPCHNHPAGEDLLMLEGTAVVAGALLKAGDYLYTPAGFKHSVRTDTGCTFMLVIPEEVEILADRSACQ